MKVPYAIVRDNHGDLQQIPIIDGQCILLPGYLPISVTVLTVDPNCSATLQLGNKEPFQAAVPLRINPNLRVYPLKGQDNNES